MNGAKVNKTKMIVIIKKKSEIEASALTAGLCEFLYLQKTTIHKKLKMNPSMNKIVAGFMSGLSALFGLMAHGTGLT